MGLAPARLAVEWRVLFLKLMDLMCQRNQEKIVSRSQTGFQKAVRVCQQLEKKIACIYTYVLMCGVSINETVIMAV